jgi:hypothetical protein
MTDVDHCRQLGSCMAGSMRSSKRFKGGGIRGVEISH